MNNLRNRKTKTSKLIEPNTLLIIGRICRGHLMNMNEIVWGILSRSVDHNKKIFKTENKHKKTCSPSAGLSRYKSFMNARSDFCSCSATSTSLTTKSFMNSSRGYFNIISSNLKLIQMIKNYHMMNESHNNMSYKDNTFF
jgi:hypothetical protein